tara:strand:- start:68 stop:313 length:246 start_codon:yes stop_codon:yes gene_type:complete
MTEQQQHLANLLEQRDTLNEELGKLQNAAAGRRELFLKVQGAVEYLQQTGVTLPEPEPQEEAEVAETEVVEEELPTSKKKA